MPVLMPNSLRAACQLLSGYASSAIPIAGGTDLMVHWPERIDLHQRTYLDLSAIDELKPILWSEQDLILGGLTTYWDVCRDSRMSREFPLLVDAARQIGALQIQTRGTWAGNIANASPAADGVVVMMVYDAIIELISKDGVEEIPLSEYFLGYKTTRRRPDQIIRAIRLPRRAHTFEYFEKVGTRSAQAITKVGIAITQSEYGWRVAVNSVAPTVCRCSHLERELAAETPIASPEEISAILRQDISPIDDLRSTAEYRRKVLARLIFFALRDHCGFIG